MIFEINASVSDQYLCGGKDGWHRAKSNISLYIEPILGHLLYKYIYIYRSGLHNRI